MEQTFRPTNVFPNRQSDDFSLVLGGPLFQIFQRAYLTGTALELARRRVAIITIICWLPLLILTVIEGTAWGQSVRVPFIRDADTQARFLIALPLLICAELVVHQRMRNILRMFLDRGLVPPNARPKFDAAVESAMRLRNSITAEILLLIFVYGFGVFFLRPRYGGVDVISWQGVVAGAKVQPTIAGWWFMLVSLPFFQFLLCRWYFRIFIWARFLWQVSRIDLDLMPTHPDRAAGIGFLAQTSYAFTPLLMAQGTLLSGMMANRIFYQGAHLTQFKVDIVILVAVVVLVVLVPLLSFSPQLESAKRRARREYGNLAQAYVRQFDTKWLRGGAPPGESLLGTADVQSLADLDDSYRIIGEMRWVPFTVKTIMHLAVTTVAPVLPLTLTVLPFEEIVNRLLKIIL
jgi:hypothetical protein